MSLRLLNADSEYLERGIAPVSGPPFTMMGVFKKDGTTARNPLMQLRSTTTVWQQYTLGAGDYSEPCVCFEAQDSFGTQHKAKTTTASITGWTYCAGVCFSNISRKAYHNGEREGTNGDYCEPSDLNRLDVGRGRNATLYASGWIAELGLWNVALSVDEIKEAAAGFALDAIRPSALVFYARFVDKDDRDLLRDSGWTDHGTPESSGDHPAILYPTPPMVWPAGAVGGFVPYPRPRGLRAGMGELVGGMH